MSETSNLIPPRDGNLRRYDVLRILLIFACGAVGVLGYAQYHAIEDTLTGTSQQLSTITTKIDAFDSRMASQQTDLANVKDRIAHAEGRIDALTDSQLKGGKK